MPNRILRDGILTSERINALTPMAELFYRRLMSVVDDFGRFEAHPQLLLARCYPFHLDRYSTKDVLEWLAECGQMTADGGQMSALITCYEVNGKKYLQINNFGQRERSSKYPPVEASRSNVRVSPSNDGDLPQISAHARASNSYSNTTTRTPNAFSAFVALWELPCEHCGCTFPSSGKDLAYQHWLSVGLGDERCLPDIMRGLENHRASQKWHDGYVPSMEKWLGMSRNGTIEAPRWNDLLPAVGTAARPMTRAERIRKAVEEA